MAEIIAPRERGEPFVESMAAKKTPALEAVAPREREDPFVESVVAEKTPALETVDGSQREGRSFCGVSGC